MLKTIVKMIGVGLLAIALPIHAEEYYGFNLGGDTYDTLMQLLPGNAASVNDVVAANNVKAIFVKGYDGISQLDENNTATLYFDKKGVLFSMELSWQDSDGSVLKKLNKELSSRYPHDKAEESKTPLKDLSSYNHGDVYLNTMRDPRIAAANGTYPTKFIAGIKSKLIEISTGM